MRTSGESLRKLAIGAARSSAGVGVLVLALLWAPLVAGAGIAVEYGQALKVRSELQTAADVAVEAAAHVMVSGEDAVDDILRSTLDRNLRQRLRGLPFRLELHGRMLELHIDADVATRFAALLGKLAFHFRITSSADVLAPRSPPPAVSEPDDAEIALDRGQASPVTVTSGERPRD